MPEPPIRVLFNTWANQGNLNSQSLTAREIAWRLDPVRFRTTLLIGWSQAPDRRLAGCPHVRLARLPPRLGSVVIAARMLWGDHDVLFYPALNERASGIYRRFRALGRGHRSVHCVETSLEQMSEGRAELSSRQLYWLRSADLVSAITPAISEGLAERYALRAEVIPLGVDLELFRPADRDRREPPWRVLYVASIQPRKQTHLVLELARRLRGEAVEFHVIGGVLGDPAYYRSLLETRQRDKLDGVVFHGPMEQPEVASWMARSDVYLLPSRLEGFGKTTLEAAACGLPAIVFSDYETTAVVHGETGFQVADLEEMEEALVRLLKDRELRTRMGAAAVEHARQFAWEGVVRRWESVFETLVSGSPPRQRAAGAHR